MREETAGAGCFQDEQQSDVAGVSRLWDGEQQY